MKFNDINASSTFLLPLASVISVTNSLSDIFSAASSLYELIAITFFPPLSL